MRTLWKSLFLVMLGFLMCFILLTARAQNHNMYSVDQIIVMSKRTYVNPPTLTAPMLDVLGSTIQRTWQPETWSHECKESVIDKMVLKGWVRRVR